MGGGVKTCDDLDDSGGCEVGVQNVWKPDDVILEHSLTKMQQIEYLRIKKEAINVMW